MKGKYLGLDIGTYQIKIVDITVKKDLLLLAEPMVVRTPRFLVKNGRIEDRNGLVEIIKDVLGKRSTKIRKAIVLLNDSLVVTRDMEMPEASEKELEQMVKLDASEFLPGSIEDYAIRYRVLIPAKRNPGKRNYVLMAAVKNDLAMDFYEVLSEAGLKPEAMDVSINGMIKYMKRFQREMSPNQGEARIDMLLDIGATTVKMVIMQGSMPLFQQIMNHSFQRMDVLIANSLNIEREQAEEYKINFGLDYLYKQDGVEEARATGSIMNEQIDRMLGDIYKHMQSFSARNGSRPISAIWLTGGGSRLKGLKQYIQDSFSIPCSVVQEIQTVRLSSEGGNGQDWYPYFTNIAGAASTI